MGKWYSYQQNGFTVIEFKQDTIISNSQLFSEKGLWSVSGNQIIISDFNDSSNTNTLAVLLSKNKKSLVIEKKANQEWGKQFLKADSFEDFLIKSRGVRLPVPYDSIRQRINWKMNFNIYLTNQEGYPQFSTDTSIHPDSILSDFVEYRDNLPAEFYDKIKILVFADDKIQAEKIDQVVKELKKEFNNPIYQVYSSLIPDYSMEGIYWLSKDMR